MMIQSRHCSRPMPRQSQGQQLSSFTRVVKSLLLLQLHFAVKLAVSLLCANFSNRCSLSLAWKSLITSATVGEMELLSADFAQ